MVIVACRVVERREGVALHTLDGGSRQFGAQFVQIFVVGTERELHLVGQPVETDVLHGSRAAVVVECVGEGVL